MRGREKERFSPPAVGGSVLLVSFAVLALTVFAVLSLATVRADQRVADAAAKAAEDYYAADCAAEETLAALRRGETPPGVAAEGDGVYSYVCVISDTRELRVRVDLDGEGGYRVLTWQAVSTARWPEEGALDVWDGEAD